MPATNRTIPQAQKQALIQSLNEHRINTIGELRRVERVFATLGSSDLTQPMTAAYEAKRRVHADPASNRSWNYCWLLLAKTHTDRLIPAYARAQAARPEMWGGRIPLAESVAQLTEAFVKEWSAALAQMLKYWEEAPVR
ncbi:hypothetical protein LTR78_006986 [Recurvomyces mirabilis]|uniref:Uncharacterized protein n=1 Tax=Recurvomyces mirabilis TaxID=574656 RepID=A0AAE1BZ62_9PEZI|nr:hypothetical protein LTR78_006986 [Recurvomyces mirabilis]KAK5153370.1 hypothetical protein LTS14_007539 [Recurvomyces mirabilis]